MKIIFAGTPEFAQVALARLHAAGHDIALVLTQPDRPGGRGMKLQVSPVKAYALAHGLPVAQPRSLRLDGKYPQDAVAAAQAIAAAHAQAMVVAAYGLILPQWVLDAPQPYHCFNIHASLLPRWRGAAPIHRAIEAGDLETGVTIMQMDAGLDTGDMLSRTRLPIAPEDTTATLHDKLAVLGAELMEQTLEQAVAGQLQAQAQPATGVCYAHKIEKSEAAIDWRQDALQITRRIRALDPAPVATTALRGETLKVWSASVAGPAPAHAVPGQVLAVNAQAMQVAAGQGSVLLAQLQRPGGRRLGVAEFTRGHPIAVGEVLT